MKTRRRVGGRKDNLRFKTVSAICSYPNHVRARFRFILSQFPEPFCIFYQKQRVTFILRRMPNER